MKVACVLLNYNDSKRINNLVSLLLSYNLFSNIVVSDNNSKDKDNLTNFDNELVTILYNKENKGYARGNNVAFRYLEDKNIDYVLTLNSDILITKENIELMINFMECVDNYGACSIHMIERNKYKKSYYRIPTPFNSIVKLPYKPEKKTKETNNIKYFDVGYVRESCTLYDYKKIEGIGFYDESFFLYEEGPSLSLHFKKLGYKEAIVGTKENYYIHNHVGKLYSKSSFDYFKKSRIHYLKKYYNNPRLAIFLVKIFYHYIDLG